MKTKSTIWKRLCERAARLCPNTNPRISSSPTAFLLPVKSSSAVGGVHEGGSCHRLSSCAEGVFPSLAHKTEKGMVRVDVRSEQEAVLAFEELTSRMEGNGKDILVQEMIREPVNWWPG